MSSQPNRWSGISIGGTDNTDESSSHSNEGTRNNPGLHHRVTHGGTIGEALPASTGGRPTLNVAQLLGVVPVDSEAEGTRANKPGGTTVASEDAASDPAELRRRLQEELARGSYSQEFLHLLAGVLHENTSPTAPAAVGEEDRVVRHATASGPSTSPMQAMSMAGRASPASPHRLDVGYSAIRRESAASNITDDGVRVNPSTRSATTGPGPSIPSVRTQMTAAAAPARANPPAQPTYYLQDIHGNNLSAQRTPSAAPTAPPGPPGAARYSNNQGNPVEPSQDLGLRNVYIVGLPPDFTPATFRDLCGKYGAVEAIKVKIDATTQPTRGHGFALFFEQEAARRCIAALNGAVLRGTHRLQARYSLDKATPQALRQVPPRPVIEEPNPGTFGLVNVSVGMPLHPNAQQEPGHRASATGSQPAVAPPLPFYTSGGTSLSTGSFLPTPTAAVSSQHPATPTLARYSSGAFASQPQPQPQPPMTHAAAPSTPMSPVYYTPQGSTNTAPATAPAVSLSPAPVPMLSLVAGDRPVAGTSTPPVLPGGYYLVPASAMPHMTVSPTAPAQPSLQQQLQQQPPQQTQPLTMTMAPAAGYYTTAPLSQAQTPTTTTTTTSMPISQAGTPPVALSGAQQYVFIPYGGYAPSPSFPQPPSH